MKKGTTSNKQYLVDFTILLVFISGLYMAGCAPIYIPNPVSVPLHTQKGEVNVSGSAGLSGFSLQSSFALANHFGIASNVCYYSGKSGDHDINHQFYEGSIGYFNQLGNSSTRFECFAGVGWGKTTGYDTITDITNQGTYLRYYIQPSIGLIGNTLEGALSLRLAYVDFSEININNNWFWEPVLTVKIGHKALKFFGQVGISFNMSQELNVDDYEPFIFNMGISYNFGKY